MRFTFLLLFFLITTSAIANPCSKIDRSLSESRKRALTPIIAKQLNLEKVEILESYRYHGWCIIYVDIFISDRAFLFFKGDLLNNHYIDLWAGEAFSYEEQSVKEWVTKSIKGIPKELASCFAWHITHERSQ
jgi:hypothetical protein